MIDTLHHHSCLQLPLNLTNPIQRCPNIRHDVFISYVIDKLRLMEQVLRLSDSSGSQFTLTKTLDNGNACGVPQALKEVGFEFSNGVVHIDIEISNIRLTCGTSKWQVLKKAV